MDSPHDRLEACRQAGKALAIAKKSGDARFHSEQVHAQVSARAASILATHPARTFTAAQQDAISEMLASALLMNVIAGQPKQGWFSRALEDFANQQPMEQIGSMVKVISFVTILVGASSAAWAYAPTAIHWMGNRMVTATASPDEVAQPDALKVKPATPEKKAP